jgi:hypothetical protein
MNKAGGFIALHRQIMNWEWYGDANTFCLFVHLLLAANYVDGRFKGKVIKRGQLVTSLPVLSTDTGLSIRQTRTALTHLVSTGEITDESTPNYRIITIVKYDDYQTPTDKTTDDRQTIDRQVDRRSTDDLTGDRQQYNNIINKQGNKETKEQGNNDRERGTAKRFTPPTRDEILAFCAEAGLEIDVDRFLDYYESNGWMVGRNRMKDFKAAIRNWARRDRQGEAAAAKPTKTVIAQQYQQRDYSSVNDHYRDELDREMEEFMRGCS